MRVPADLPPPPAGAGRGQPVHPAATASLVFGIIGFGVIVVGGLVATILGVVARRAIAAEPDRWRGAERARAGIILGLMTSAVPVGLYAAFAVDEHGPLPLVAVLVYVALIGALAGAAGRRRRGAASSAGGAAAGAAISVGGIVVGTLVIAGLALAVGLLFDSIFRTIGDAIGDAACGGGE